MTIDATQKVGEIVADDIRAAHVFKKYGIDFGAENSETLSGYLIHHHEAIPKVKTLITLAHFDAEVLAVSDTRIEKVKIKIR